MRESLLNELPRGDGASLWAPDSCKERLLVSSWWFNHLLSPSWNFSYSECTCVLTHFCACVWGHVPVCLSTKDKLGFLFSLSSSQLTRTWGSLIGWAAWPSNSGTPCLCLSRADRHLRAFIFILFFAAVSVLHGFCWSEPSSSSCKGAFYWQNYLPSPILLFKGEIQRIKAYSCCLPTLWCFSKWGNNHEALLLPSLIIMINDCTLTFQTFLDHKRWEIQMCEDPQPHPGVHTNTQNTNRELNWFPTGHAP